MTDRNRNDSNRTDNNVAASDTVISPLRAIRSYCLDCCYGKANQIQICSHADCRIYKYRLGRKQRGSAPSAIKSIGLHCAMCSCYSINDVENCQNTGCQLYPYRMGKKSKKAVTGGNRIPFGKWKENQETQAPIEDWEWEVDISME
jgi:hypothetical protein